MSILVTAATGQYGRLVVEHLLRRRPADSLVVAVRDPARAADLAERGVSVRRADYGLPDSLTEAFEGVDRVLLVSGTALGERVRQHQNAVAAARAAGVSHLAYTSGIGADSAEAGLLAEHRATEDAIRDSGLGYTLLRHPIYTEMFLEPTVDGAIQAGVLRGSTRGRGLNTATRSDLAEAAAILLTGEVSPASTFEFTGPVWTYPELAAVLAEIGGRPVEHREVEEDEGALIWFGDVIRAGGFEFTSNDLGRVLGRPPTSIRDAAAAAVSARTA